MTGRPLAAEGGSSGRVKTGTRGRAEDRRERQGGYLQRCLNLEQRTQFGGVPTRQGTNRGGRPWRPGWGRGGPRGRGARGSGGRWLDSGDAGLMKSSGARAPCEGLGQARHGLLREREREVTERCEAREEEERKRKGRGARSGLVRRQRSPEEGKGAGQRGAAGAAPAGRWRRTGGSGSSLCSPEQGGGGIEGKLRDGWICGSGGER